MPRIVHGSFFAAVAMLTLGMLATPAHAVNTGNGATSGPRYTLNVIAFDHCPGNDLKGSERHMIAVQADYPSDINDSPAGQSPTNLITRTNDIKLGPSDDGDFHVTDGNACDSDGATFLLPPDAITCDLNDPDCFNDPTFQSYAVYLRLVGPTGKINVTTCATAPGDDGVLNTADDVIECSTESVVKARTTKSGKPHFDDVSKQLLTVCLDTDMSGTCDTRYALFDPALEDYFWNWNTEGRPHAQLFFITLPD